MEQRADVGGLGFPRHELLACLARQTAGQVGAQEGLLQFASAALVLHVLKKQDRHRDIAQRIETQHDHGARDGADGAA